MRSQSFPIYRTSFVSVVQIKFRWLTNPASLVIIPSRQTVNLTLYLDISLLVNPACLVIIPDALTVNLTLYLDVSLLANPPYWFSNHPS